MSTTTAGAVPAQNAPKKPAPFSHRPHFMLFAVLRRLTTRTSFRPHLPRGNEPTPRCRPFRDESPIPLVLSAFPVCSKSGTKHAGGQPKPGWAQGGTVEQTAHHKLLRQAAAAPWLPTRGDPPMDQTKRGLRGDEVASSPQLAGQRPSRRRRAGGEIRHEYRPSSGTRTRCYDNIARVKRRRSGDFSCLRNKIKMRTCSLHDRLAE